MKQDHHQQAHICQCLRRIATQRRDSWVTIFGNRRKTGLEFVRSVETLAFSLRQLGVSPSDVVAIAALNSDWYLEWILAVTFVGGVIAPLNYRWSFKEARSALEVLRPVMFVFDDNCDTWYFELQKNNLSFIRWHVHVSGPFPILKSTGKGILNDCFQTPPYFGYCWAPGGVALICFTSGTTGKPKGVAISHIALIVQSLAKIALVGYNEDDVYLHTAPLCHIGGISSGLAMLMVGARHVILPKFEAKSVLKAVEEHHISSLITVPTMMADLISCIRNWKSWKGGGILKKILNGGGGLSLELMEHAKRSFPNAKLLSAYGGGKSVATSRGF